MKIRKDMTGKKTLHILKAQKCSHISGLFIHGRMQPKGYSMFLQKLKQTA